MTIAAGGTEPLLLEASGVVKTYGAVTALRNASLAVTTVDSTLPVIDTHLFVMYKFNSRLGTGHSASRGGARFDVQLTQGLPFLAPLTRADWELLLAVRNMFYEASQAGFLDELAVQDPPTRVVGGISVRF